MRYETGAILNKLGVRSHRLVPGDEVWGAVGRSPVLDKHGHCAASTSSIGSGSRNDDQAPACTATLSVPLRCGMFNGPRGSLPEVAGRRDSARRDPGRTAAASELVPASSGT